MFPVNRRIISATGTLNTLFKKQNRILYHIFQISFDKTAKYLHNAKFRTMVCGCLNQNSHGVEYVRGRKNRR
ncbi:Uncharacterised protein [Neisseria animalis]|nr:Uncharacterised protein [Neisseria animalis]